MINKTGTSSLSSDQGISKWYIPFWALKIENWPKNSNYIEDAKTYFISIYNFEVFT